MKKTETPLLMQHEEIIQGRLQHTYFQKLDRRVRKMRQLYVHRKWPELRIEATQLRIACESFGFPELLPHAVAVEQALPEGQISSALGMPQAKVAIETLLRSIDHILILGHKKP
jgi:hypothetical protein